MVVNKNKPPHLSVTVCTMQIELKFGNVGFWGEGKTGVPREKRNLSEQGGDQEQTQPTYRRQAVADPDLR